MANDILVKKRAIEALRSGVPSSTAVKALCCTQPEIETKFREKLEGLKNDLPNGIQTTGLLVSGDFGSGKSHLLEHLHLLALENNFVSSRIVISKETPLHDPVKLYRAAIESAVVPGIRGAALPEIATKLKPNTYLYSDFDIWLNSPASGLSSHFAATLFIFKEARNNPETVDRIIRFWSGDKLGVSDIRRFLRELGESATFRVERMKEKELAWQRFKFVPRLLAVAGYAGWVLLIDEVELIGRYSLLQRAKSYAELARMMGKLEESNFAGLVCVMAVTDDFSSEILDPGRKYDLEKVPNRLRARGNEQDLLLASQAEKGMRLLEKDSISLKMPDNHVLKEIYNKVKILHKEAYGWNPPDVTYPEQLSTTRVRDYIKLWINEWDLKRLDPEYQPEPEIEKIGPSYEENPDIESNNEENAAD